MKISKRKILIASFSAVLMLMVPLASAVTETKTVQNLQVQQSKQELAIKVNDNRRGFLKVIYMIAEDLLQELLDAGLNVNENTEVLQAQMQQILANEGDALATDLNENLCEGLLAPGENPVGQGIGNTGVGATSGGVSGSFVVQNTATGMELKGTSSQLEYFESYENIYSYLAGDVFTGFTPEQIQERLGWINGLIKFIDQINNAKKEWQDTFIPNVTWVQIIEDDAYIWLGADISIQQFFDNLEAHLLEKYAGHPLIETIVPAVLQWIYDKLNKKVGDNLKSFVDKLIKSIRTFIRVWGGKNTDMSPRKALRKILFLALVVGVDAWLLAFHMNPVTYPGRIDSWLSEMYNARQNLSENLTKFYDWLGSEPWLEPVHIKGNVTGCTQEQLMETVVYCEKDPSTSVSVTVDENGIGHFEGLDFITCDESYPRGLHKCVTMASNSIGTITLGNHIGSGSLIQNILEVGAFSGGNLTLNFDFSGQGNSYPNGYVVQTQNSNMVTQQTTKTTAQYK